MNTNYNNHLLLQQQQQLQQQQHQNAQQGGQQSQQQQPAPSLQPDQSMNQNNMDQARMQQWAQMRYGQNAAADMSHAKSAQFAEMMKRTPVSNQFGRHQSQHSFAAAATMGLGMQNGANVLGGNPQQQTFLEQHPSNMTPQPHLSQSFPNMGVMSNGNANAAASASLQGRNPSGVHPGSQVARPLDMMQGQQPQNNSVNPNKFPQPQSLRDSQQIQFPQGLNPNSPDMFPDGIRRPSPHPGAMQQAPGLGQGVQVSHPAFMGAMSGANRPQTIDFQQRIHSLQTNIRSLETQNASLQAQAANYRGNPAMEAQFNQQSNEFKTEIAKRKDYMAKLLHVWKQLQSGQHPNIAAGNGGQSSNNQWATHTNPGQPFDPNGQTRPPSMGLLPNPPTHTMQTSPNLSAQANPLLNSGLLPPRTIPTPQQPPQSIPPHANTLNGMAFTKPNALLPKGPTGIGSVQGGGNAMTNFISPVSLLGMDRAQFDSNFKTFLMRRGGNIDPHRLLEGRPLDLHALYLQVMQEGGLSKMEGNDNLWSIIAARLGYVQFPGTATEPAKSGPGVAQSMQHLYKEYIAPFEAWYVAMVQEYKKHSNAALYSALSGSRYGMQQLLQMANMPPGELQSQGVDEKTLQLLETHKGSLQRLLQDQRAFAESLRNNAAQNAGHGDQNGAMSHRMGSSPLFGASSSQQTPQQNLLSIASRTQLQHHLMQQQGAQHLQSTIPNGVDTLMGARMTGQQISSSLTPQGAMGGNTMQSFVQKATVNQAHAAQLLVEQFKNEYAMSPFPNANLDVPIEHQVEYTQVLEQLHRQCAEMERRLGMVAFILKDVDENLLKRVIMILCAVNQQRNNMSSASGPRYIVALDPLKTMANDLGRINEIFIAHYQNLKLQQMQKQQLGLRPQPPQMSNNLMPPPVGKQEMPPHQGRATMPHNRTPSEVHAQQPQPSQLPSQPQPPPLNPTRSSASLQPPKRKRPQTPSSSAVASSPSPIPITSAPTPVANTPTPTAAASSPPANKSPKAKASKSKAASKQRRSSKVVQSVTVAPTVEETTTLPSSVAAGKRAREEESTPNSGGSGNNAGESSEVLHEGSPPKRLRTEWEAQPSEAQRKQSEVVANIKTDEDATALFDQMTELIKRAAEEEGGQPSLITTGISETLDMLLKGYGPVPDAMDRFSGASMSTGESSSSRDPDAAPTLGDPFDEFFDFSFGTVEDEDSKTPDLVSSSSTNPSPESNHDADSGHHLLSSASSSTLDVKTEDFSDPLRLGTWKEIDGGEAAYFQTTEWKYDSPMTSFEQPWAIFNS